MQPINSHDAQVRKHIMCNREKCILEQHLTNITIIIPDCVCVYSKAKEEESSWMRSTSRRRLAVFARKSESADFTLGP